MAIWTGIWVCGRRGQYMHGFFLGWMSITSGLISLIVCENLWLAQLYIFLLTSALMIDSNILHKKRNACYAYLVYCINWVLNTDIGISKVSMMYGTRL